MAYHLGCFPYNWELDTQHYKQIDAPEDYPERVAGSGVTANVLYNIHAVV